MDRLPINFILKHFLFDCHHCALFLFSMPMAHFSVDAGECSINHEMTIGKHLFICLIAGGVEYILISFTDEMLDCV